MCCKALLAFLIVHVWKLCIVNSTSLTSNITDLHSLIAFKAAIEFDPNNVLTNNWTIDTNFCNWYGVSCSKRRQRVTVLSLSSMGLVGHISPYVGNFSFLTVLDLTENSFHGQIIHELGRLSRLATLWLGSNKLRGEIPTSLSLCRKLYDIDFAENGLTGALHKNLTTLPNLQYLTVGLNKLAGKISFGNNTSMLEWLGLEFNNFHGTILNEVAIFPRITKLYLGGNHFTGTLPASLFNVSSLEELALEGNNFIGELPKETGLQLPNLNYFYLNSNKLTGTIPSHLYNASRLLTLAIGVNNFTGTLPAALPLSLQKLFANQCNLEGEIPKGIGNLKNMTYLELSGSRISGIIPPEIKGMESLQQLYLFDNELEGPIPEEICSLKNLGILSLGKNRFSGPIPECVGNLSVLQKLSLDSNGLQSTIPWSLWSLHQLWYLNLSSNSFNGDLDINFMTIKSLGIVDLSLNQLSGNIPDILGSFQSLTFLDLSWNSFSGPIPESLGNLISLIDLNISNNNLSGQIPKSLEAISFLKNLNLSYNKLSGKIPSGGPFVNFTAQSFVENRQLCGESISKPCPIQGLRKSRNKLFPLSYIVPIVVVLLILVVLFYVSRKCSRNNVQQNPEIALQEQRMISYHELSLATNGFSDTNLLGSGGFGKVYKGILSDGNIVAVKLLKLTIDGAMRSFDAECKVLRKVRHRNLVKVISTCTNPELRALVLEYIPNGSLEKWLYSHNYYLSFLQRISIMLDVAVAIDYLHYGQLEPVIHCDLKPSNILLDEEMVARVSDFGIAKVLAENKLETQTSTLGTFGYIAPEYGTEGRVSTKGDAYSYGITLLETFTRKKPTDEIFSEELSLRKWVSSSVPDKIDDVIDENLLNEINQGRSVTSSQRSLLDVLNIGLGCSRDSPDERFDMKDVVTKLNKIKLRILSE